MTDSEEEDYLWNISIPKTKGQCKVKGIKVEKPDISEPLKNQQVNSGTEEEPKFVKIGDNWDEDTIGKVAELMHEYQGLFPIKFLDLKGIVEDLGVIKITLKLDVKPIKQWPYQLNLKYKEKVNLELDKMMESSIIEPVEESD